MKHFLSIRVRTSAHLGSRLLTPEPVADYAYVNYHDTSNGRASLSKDEKGQPRSILKNKQVGSSLTHSSSHLSVDVEQRSGGDDAVGGRHEGGAGVGPVRSVIDRLRRHLSLEKSTSPQRQVAPQQTTLGASTRVTPLTTMSREAQDRIAEDSPKKKRSILSFNRRRTSEVRMGSDGKLITNGYDDSSQYKRPNSPIEKIKSLFRKNEPASTKSSALPNNDYYAGRYSGASASDKVYGAYPSTNVASGRDAYVPQYRKYPG
ncbi:unnamed protein product [Heligmosomoides polygyrus]|uniref:Microtubule-associated protein futsch n=1 Tax=Heligmosomoides polygyrus TaxID=6339 RepID=A0A3P7ZHS3_HELPZ|nr:unnamed protein product [Heligmosomoides polygyrus]